MIGDAILGVIQVKAHSLGGHPLAAAGIVPKEFPEMQLPNLVIVGFQGLPGRAFGERRHARCHVRAPFVLSGKRTLTVVVHCRSPRGRGLTPTTPARYSRSAGLRSQWRPNGPGL